MKRIILFAIISILGMAFFAETAYCLPWPPDVDLVSIEFNYNTTSNTYDALTIVKRLLVPLHYPEWDSSGGYNDPMAYIKSQSARRIEAVFYADWYSHEDMLIRASKISGTGIGNVNSTWVSFDGHESDPTLMTCSSSVPSSVGIREFKWRWYLLQIDEFEYETPILIGDSGDHKFYTVFAQPQNPMAVAWTEVLDYSCDWASGQTTNSVIAQKITEGIYDELGDTDGDIDYDWPYGQCMYSSGLTLRTFNLRGFLDDLEDSDSVEVNCSDVGNLFNIFSAALGLASGSKRIMKTDYPYNFLTNEINPIGDSTPYEWVSALWGYHQYGWYDSKVDDACLMVNQGSPILPYNMTQGIYDGYLLYPEEDYNESDTGVATVY